VPLLVGGIETEAMSRVAVSLGLAQWEDIKLTSQQKGRLGGAPYWWQPRLELNP
jgi:hypothetical protein